MKNEYYTALGVILPTLFLALHAWGGNNVPYPIEEEASWELIRQAVKEKGRTALPQVASHISQLDCSSQRWQEALLWAFRLDGRDVLEEGCPELLEATRKTFSVLLKRDNCFELPPAHYGFVYLAQKGDSRDLPILERFLDMPEARTNQNIGVYLVGMPFRILQTRVAGTNIVTGLFSKQLYPAFFPGQYSYSTNDLRFIPSVANTGPQAAYVYKAFRRAIFREPRTANEDFYNNMAAYIPPEMLTMRVWFDKDGKALTDVDLSKYGVSVPGLDFATNAPPICLAAKVVMNIPSGLKSSDVASSRSWLILAVALLFGIIVAILLWIRTRKKRSDK